MDDLKYKIGIGLIPGVGDIIAKNLISYCGGVAAVFMENKKSLLKVSNIGESLANSIINNREEALAKAEKEIDFINKHNISYAFYLDNNYPSRLRNCDDAPVIFYYKGDVDFENSKAVSIVGTRQATQYGKDMCNHIVDELRRLNHNPIIISGLAYGIDICAHRAALRNGLPTIAVLGHGLTRIYPAAHASAAREIIRNGALLTEFLSDTPIDRNNFVRRNRLIAGLADLTVVVESNISGGALITADIANSYNRDVFACPGRISDTFSSGCNKLIRTNKANLLQSVEDIEIQMNWDKKPQMPVQRELFRKAVSPEEENILRVLNEKGECSIDNLCFELKMQVNKVSPMLLNLELSELILSLPGKMYKTI